MIFWSISTFPATFSSVDWGISCCIFLYSMGFGVPNIADLKARTTKSGAGVSGASSMNVAPSSKRS